MARSTLPWLSGRASLNLITLIMKIFLEFFFIKLRILYRSIVLNFMEIPNVPHLSVECHVVTRKDSVVISGCVESSAASP